MKQLIIIVLAFITMSTNAQKEKMQSRQDFTPEQQATLKTKQMALNLDLSESQQSKIQQINLEKAKHRVAKRKELKKIKAAGPDKLSSDERFKMKSEALDRALAHKRQVKNILSKEQFEKWEKKAHRKTLMRKKIMHKKMRRQMTRPHSRK